MRVAAIRLRSVSPITAVGTGNFAQLLLGNGLSEPVQSAAIAMLGRYDYPEIPGQLVDRWPVLTPILRNQAIAALLGRNNRVSAVLTELENGRIAPGDMDSTQIDFLRTYRDPAIRERAARLFGAATSQRAAVYERFKPAPAARGDASRGRQIFEARCVGCHRLGGDGQTFGPDLRGAKMRGKEGLLRAILVPGLDIAPGYTTQVLETGAGENLIGVKSSENPSTIALRQPNGVEFVWPRANIQSIQAQPWSLMPEGLEEALSPDEMAGLLEYILVGQ